MKKRATPGELAEFDAYVLQLIEGGEGRAGSIWPRFGRFFHVRDAYRVTDRTLQRLRKAGKIEFLAGEWRLVKARRRA